MSGGSAMSKGTPHEIRLSFAAPFVIAVTRDLEAAHLVLVGFLVDRFSYDSSCDGNIIKHIKLLPSHSFTVKECGL